MSIVDQIFPPAPPHLPHQRRAGNQNFVREEWRDKSGRRRREEIHTKWAAIYQLELRGLSQKEIAEVMHTSVTTICRITQDDRYIAYREAHLTAMDAEFIAMKPLAFNALKSGLNSNDQNTALRASEQWFKGAGFGGFSKDPVPASRTTAEDVAAALIAGVQVNVTVNTGDK